MPSRELLAQYDAEQTAFINQSIYLHPSSRGQRAVIDLFAILTPRLEDFQFW